jgi:hypothetical protein
MGRETGLTKREQQTARRKLLALGVIAIERRGFKFTYHFKVIWEKLYQMITGSQQTRTVSTEKSERQQTVPTQQEQNVSTKPAEGTQNVITQWRQNVLSHNRDYNTENRETEKTDRKNETVWQQTIEQVQADLPPGEAATQLRGTTLLQVTDTAARIKVPNAYTVAWLERQLYGQIAKAMKGVVGKDLDLLFVAAS